MENKQQKQSSTVNVSVTRHFSQPAEKVFDAWLDPETAGKWLFSTPTGKMVRVQIDARPGGKFIFTDCRDGEDIDHTGVYETIDRPKRIAFNFGVPKYTGRETTRVSVDITPRDGGCDITLTHKGVWPDYAERTKSGWTGILEGLAKTLG